jgi:hypothetical protein
MKKLILLIGMVLILFPAGCSDSGQDGTIDQAPLFLDPEHTRFAFYDSDAVKLFSIFYRIQNRSNDELGPMYVEFIFHDDALVESMVEKPKTFAPHQELKHEPIALSPGEVYQSGYSFEAVNEPDLADNLRKNLKDRQIVEIRFVELETDEMVANFWIDALEYIDGEAEASE